MPKRHAEAARGPQPPKRHRACEQLQHLYDKTLNLLFAGANRKNNNNEEYDKNEHCNKTNSDLGEFKHFKQMYINNNGSLDLNGIIKLPGILNCVLCKNILADRTSCCSYCESLQCSSCADYCTACNLPTCNRCSISSYNGHSGIFCLSCCR